VVNGQSLNSSPFLLEVQPCNSSSGNAVCGTTALSCFNFVSNPDLSEYLALMYEQGVQIYDISIPSKPFRIQTYSTSCDTLYSVGFRDGSLLMSHTDSTKCTCDNPGVITCNPYLLINAPKSIAGPVTMVPGIGTVLVTSLAGDVTAQFGLVQANDSDPTLGCSPLVNDLTGKVALVFRGSCDFQTKVENAVAAGAIAVVVVNTPNATLFSMFFDMHVDVPAVMISNVDGVKIQNALASGEVVVTYGPTIGGNETFDSSSGLLEIPLWHTAPPTKHTKDFKFADFVTMEPIRPLMWVYNPDLTSNTILVFNFTRGYNDMELVANISTVGDLAPLSAEIFSVFNKGNNTYGIINSVSDSLTYLVDITDPSSPVILGSVFSDFTQFSAVDTTHSVLYTDTSPHVIAPSILVVDISDVNNMTIIANITEDFAVVGGGVNAIVVSRNMLWVSWGSDGVSVYDITNPRKPSRVGYIDVSPESGDYTVGSFGLCVSATSIDAFSLNINSPTEQQVEGLHLNSCA